MTIAYRGAFRPRLVEESPWYWPIAPWLARFAELARFPTPEELSALYRERSAGLDLPALRFVASTKSKKRRTRSKPIELAALYEGRIVERGEVPTRRDDWHDLFNALAFFTFPRAKYALHARQYALLRARLKPDAWRLPNARTREQDALVLFDEGGLCVAVAPAAVELVAAGVAASDEGALRAAILRGMAQVVPFGHALYEHLAAGLPCPLGTAHVLPLAPAATATPELPPQRWLDQVDLALARALADPAAFCAPSGARGSSLTALPTRQDTPAVTR